MMRRFAANGHALDECRSEFQKATCLGNEDLAVYCTSEICLYEEGKDESELPATHKNYFVHIVHVVGRIKLLKGEHVEFHKSTQAAIQVPLISAPHLAPAKAEVQA